MPPYTSETETTCDPAASDWRTVAVVAEPEEKAREYLACSRAATACSKLSLPPSQPLYLRNGRVCDRPVGVCTARVLVETNWTAHTGLCKGCREGDLVAVVLASCAIKSPKLDRTGAITAPVVGSWGAPAWTASVPNWCSTAGPFSIDPMTVYGVRN